MKNCLFMWMCLAFVFFLLHMVSAVVWLGRGERAVGESSPVLQVAADSDSLTSTGATVTSDAASDVIDADIAIFYNAFVPSTKGQKGIDLAFGIIRRQLEQVAESYAASQSKPVTVHYNSIGSTMLNKTSMAGLCNNTGRIRCEHMDHYDSGFEEVTLVKLHNYCTNHLTHRVVYMHNKGSFHPSKGQENWGYHGTAAATNKLCLDAILDNTCNVCSLLWYPFPFLHPPGNFWTAQCSYVAKLLPPLPYDAALQDFLFSKTGGKSRFSNFTFFMFQGEKIMTERHMKTHPAAFGIQRYAMENWIGSHPAIVPCDLSVAERVDYWIEDRRDVAEFEWSLFPRRNVSSGWAYVHEDRLSALLADTQKRVKEFYLLPGRISVWQTLYTEALPAADSWIWSFFPDSQYWKNALLN
jgi:hypothetical protein